MRQPWPTSLRFQTSAAQLVVAYDDGAEVTIPYRRLRSESPSADVQGHGSGPKPAQAPVPADITVEKAEPIG
ncbi:MAG: gamma-butyrobetaine hydroxylase-like domain-containing protein, partial [Pseudomonadota bacterium]